jgi:glycosyltransferase involved in cell wall biosynthesis
MPNRHVKEPFRVVLLLQDLFFGGTQRHTLELARGLNPARFQTEIWVMRSGDDFVPLARRWHLSLKWLGRSPFVGPDSLVRLGWNLKNQPVDLLMLLTGVPNIWGRLLGRLTKVPLIIGNLRGTGSPERNFEKWLWPLADHFSCNAAILKKMMLDRFPIRDDRITVIHNGVNLDYFRPATGSLPVNKQVVLCIARFVPEKDHETLIAAFSQVAARHPEAELWLVGDGPGRQAVHRLATRRIPPRQLRLLPGQSDITSLLHQSSLLVLSSIQEGLPNVVLEAMAAGLPVVATDVGGLPEVVQQGETGWLVAPKDVPALADAVSHLLTHDQVRTAFGQAGRERAERRFSLASMIQQHEDLFLHLLHRPFHKGPLARKRGSNRGAIISERR